MCSKRLRVAALSLTIFLVALITLGVASEDLQKMLVVNLETPHPVSGEVEVRGTIRHAAVVRFSDLVVSPASPDQPTQWTDAGSVDTAGFTSLVLSLQGQVKGTLFREGEIGVILLPDEEPFQQAFREGEVHLPLQVSTRTAPNLGAYFSASQPDLAIAFPRYRVLLFNSTDRSTTANVILYLTN
jgi:hypothetical protein